MKLGFDAKRAAQNTTGLGNYSRLIISILAKFGQNLDLNLYIPSLERAKLLKELPESEQIHLKFPQGLISKHFPSIWRTWGISSQLQKDNIQIYHGLSGELPLNIRKAHNIGKIVTIHDLIFRHFPQNYHFIDRHIYNFKFRRACQSADHIIAISRFTKEEIIHYYHIPEEKISVIYQGCHKIFQQPATEQDKKEVKEIYQLDQPYILYVGTIEKRKNLFLLAKALKRISTDIKVVAVGRRTPYADEIDSYLETEHLSARMTLLQDVPLKYLPALYQMASVFVYPSRCEGFGIPMLEALCSGTPAIGCTGSCLEEAGGPGSAYVDPDDDIALAREINDILSNPKRREMMTSTGKEFAKRFNEQQIYQDLMQVYAHTLATISSKTANHKK
jgi:glycosyltransferase involved in cell wall biosynthesis